GRRPTTCYDIVVEVPIIRPGPVVGNMVQPYLQRGQGQGPVVYPHPSLEPILARTLGVPLFQEQLLRMAMVAAGFSGGEAEELRRAFGFKRSEKRMQQIEGKLRAGMARQGITGDAAEEIIRSITSFALYGFPESHAASFALLVYASAYLKAHYPAAFYSAMLNNQPMGFYHPSTLVKDAQRHGVRFAPVDVQISDWLCRVEPDGRVRLGLMYVNGLRKEVGQAIEWCSEVRGARSEIRTPNLEATELRCPKCGADDPSMLETLHTHEGFCNVCSHVWALPIAAGSIAGGPRTSDLEPRTPDPAPRTPDPDTRSPLKPMTVPERLLADYAGTSLTIGPHPMSLRRAELALRGVLPASDLPRGRHGRRVRVAGAVITRQRPGTAKGFVFLTLEDETGIANIIVRPDLFSEQRATIV